MGASYTKSNDNNVNMSGSSNERDRHVSSSTRPLSIEGSRSSNDSTAGPLRPMENQPRQPSNMQGLLRFAIEASQNESRVQNSQIQPMDRERTAFLSEALSSLSVNVIEELQKAIKILSNVSTLRPEDDPSEYESVLSGIADYVDNIDIANDFYKIGGFAIFGSCLQSPHSSIRWRTADIIAELSQNNPFCQERVLEAGLFPTLLGLIDTDPSEAARIKALYAVSCIVRGHPMSLKYMEINDGYSVLLRAMQSSVEKLQIKSAFLLSALCYKENSDQLRTTLVNMGLVEQVAGFLALPSIVPDTRAHMLKLLSGLTYNGFDPALKECRRLELCLKQTLEQCLKDLKADENPDEIETCQQLLNTLFSGQETPEER